MANTDAKKRIDDDLTAAQMVAEAAWVLNRSHEIRADATGAEFGQSHLAEYEARIRQEDACNFQTLLAQCGGNYETLAVKLHHYMREQSREKHALNFKKVQNKKLGRPAARWGAENAGKIMVATIINAELGKMRTEGIPKPKIKDAIARAYGIPADKRLRQSNMRTINDYARTYSEVKKILKTVPKKF
jgi:hypothetical protein